MHRIDGAGFALGNLFTEGNPGSAVPATVVTAAWLNDMQEEGMSILVAGGVAPVKGTQNQVLAAIRAIIKAKGVEYAGEAIIATTGTLDASHAGKVVVFNSATPITVTLPAASAFSVGAGMSFINVNTGVVTLQRAGTDTLSVSSTPVTSLVVGNGDTLTLESFSAGGWRAISGSAQLGYSAAFGSSLAANGYQRLPGGLIIQQGGLSVSANNAATPITFPIAFPTAVRQVLISPVDNGTAAYRMSTGLTTLAGTSAYCTNTVAVSGSWIAIGN